MCVSESLFCFAISLTNSFFASFQNHKVATSITTLVLTDGHLVDAASYTTVGLAPYAAYQKHQLQQLGGMRGQQNQLRSSVNELQEQNNILTLSLDKLDTQVTK
jgi:hypothetical protein